MAEVSSIWSHNNCRRLTISLGLWVAKEMRSLNTAKARAAWSKTTKLPDSSGGDAEGIEIWWDPPALEITVCSEMRVAFICQCTSLNGWSNKIYLFLLVKVCWRELNSIQLDTIYKQAHLAYCEHHTRFSMRVLYWIRTFYRIDVAIFKVADRLLTRIHSALEVQAFNGWTY